MLNNSGAPSEGSHRFLWCSLLQPFIASDCNSVKDFRSYFFPSCRLKMMRSEANQADTAVRLKELKVEKTVVRVEVTAC